VSGGLLRRVLLAACFEGFGGNIPSAHMVSAISKTAAVCLVLGFVVACSADAPGGSTAMGGASTMGGSSTAGSAGGGGSPAAAGSNNGGSQPIGGSGVAGSTPAGGAGAGGQAQGGTGGAGGSGSGGASGGSAGSGGMAGAGGSAMADFLLTSPVLEHVEACNDGNHTPCKVFPLTNVMTTIGGQNMSPELNWGPGPAGTMSYAIGLKDLTNMYVHWVIWNMPVGTQQLATNFSRAAMPPMPAGASQKSFSKDDSGYMGPGAKDHIYEFRLYALNMAKFTPTDPTDQVKIYNQLEANAGNFVIKKVMLRGVSPK
jgi:Raf kinase inhibitor-like YbhB/YbcL family protein